MSSGPATPVQAKTNRSLGSDPHSFSNPEQIKVRHLDLKVTISFSERVLHGIADLAVEHLDPAATELILDTMALSIVNVEWSKDGEHYRAAKFLTGDFDVIRGTALKIELPYEATRVRVEYTTSPAAPGLQWLESSQTTSKTAPFLLTQSQTIHARSWLPLQDTPQVRITYRATVYCPNGLLALMGAANNSATHENPYVFEMPQQIPSYLMALAVGDLTFRPISKRTGVFAESVIVDKAANEFSDIETMMRTAERLYGSYRWDRYDLLVLPAGFPLGGMENPRLTFVTPTILAGDRSLVSLLAHELAHSWAGNLVTNATWSDFWLNEGFSVYVERRIVEEIFGRKRAEMEMSLGLQRLNDEMANLGTNQQILYAKCEDPEDCVTQVPYEKGALFLTQLERAYGRARFDDFLRNYFDHFAFQSIRTSDFTDYLTENLIRPAKSSALSVHINEWIYEIGLPDPVIADKSNDPFREIRIASQSWLSNLKTLHEAGAYAWTVQEWLYFLKSIPNNIGCDRLTSLDAEFQLTSSDNSEVLHQWLLVAIRAGYTQVERRLEEYLVSIGREKLIKPLYEELAKTESGKERAKKIYRSARPGYHPLVLKKIDRILGWQQ